jgi:hypothetical protein
LLIDVEKLHRIKKHKLFAVLQIDEAKTSGALLFVNKNPLQHATNAFFACQKVS